MPEDPNPDESSDDEVAPADGPIDPASDESSDDEVAPADGPIDPAPDATVAATPGDDPETRVPDTTTDESANDVFGADVHTDDAPDVADAAGDALVDAVEAGETTVISEGWTAESSVDSTATLAAEPFAAAPPDRDDAGLFEASHVEVPLEPGPQVDEATSGVAADDEAEEERGWAESPPMRTADPLDDDRDAGRDQDDDYEVGDDDEEEEVGKRSGTRNAIEWLVIIVGALVAAFVIKTFLVQAFFIPSASMDPTLAVGDRVLVNKMSYRLHDVHRGDLIVFERPPASTGPEKDLIKRVVGLPGETIESRDGEIFINGRRLDEPYLEDNINPGDPVVRRRLPRDHYWVMGDNRGSSSDSRVFGPIDEDTIVGRAFIRVWPIFDLTLL